MTVDYLLLAHESILSGIKYGTLVSQVTDDDVDRLHTTPLDNISGYRDFHQEFHEWHETLSVSTYNGDLLHLLPYVVIE